MRCFEFANGHLTPGIVVDMDKKYKRYAVIVGNPESGRNYRRVLLGDGNVAPELKKDEVDNETPQPVIMTAVPYVFEDKKKYRFLRLRAERDAEETDPATLVLVRGLSVSSSNRGHSVLSGRPFCIAWGNETLRNAAVLCDELLVMRPGDSIVVADYDDGADYSNLNSNKILTKISYGPDGLTVADLPKKD